MNMNRIVIDWGRSRRREGRYVSKTCIECIDDKTNKEGSDCCDFDDSRNVSDDAVE